MSGTMRRWISCLFVGASALGVFAAVGPTAAANSADVGYTVAGAAAALTGPNLASQSASIDSAWQWIRSMIDSPTTVVSNSDINPTEAYDFDWTGPTSGTFELIGMTPPPIDQASVMVDGDSASQSSADFRGVVTGRVTLPAATNRWIIQAYRDDDGVRVQVPLQAMAAPDGTFAIDLGAVQNPGDGTWELGVLDAKTGYAPIGFGWPGGDVYQNLEVVSYSTTDVTYRTGSTPAAADGTFAFASSSPGVKSFQLVDSNSGEVLAEYRPVTGLVRSYGPESDLPEVTFTYDQALALQSSMVMDDAATAAILARGLLKMQTGSGVNAGGFIAESPQLNPGAGDQRFYTGNQSVAVYALVSYLRYANHETSLETPVRQAITNALGWLEGQRFDTGLRSGLYAGGWSNGQLDWAGIEHNLDVWQALNLAATVMPCNECQSRADELKLALISVMWNQQNTRFDQGATAAGRDTVDPLDANSWGAIFLTAVDDPAKATQALMNVSLFAVTDGSASGYLAYRAQPMRPTPELSVWVEGTAGVALAYARAGDFSARDNTLLALQPLQEADGSYPMATTADQGAGLTTDSSVAATSWYLLASRSESPDSLWN